MQAGEYRSFVVADIPGLIEGAHEGAGLGIQFLRHVERTRLLVHLVDVSETGRDPVEDFRIIRNELASFSDSLAQRPMFLVASKTDAAQDPERIAALEAVARENEMQFFRLSSVTGDGLEPLRFAMADAVLGKPEE